MESGRRIVTEISIFVLLAAFLYVTHQIHSPILIGALLLFLLFSTRESPLAFRLGFAVLVILLVWFFINAQRVLFPFIVSFALAYLFDPIADWMEKHRIRRNLAALIILIVGLGFMGLMSAILIPNLIGEIQSLIRQIPGLATRTYDMVKTHLRDVLDFLKVDKTRFEQSMLQEIPKRAEQVLSNVLKGITGLGAFLGQLVNVILIPILTFYFLKDFNRLKSWAMDFVPKRYRNATHFYMWRTNRILGGYIRGQLIVCFIVGVLMGTGLAVLGLDFAVLLGILTGLLNLIPFLGFYVSLVIALLTGFFAANPWIAMLKIAILFFVIQAIEAYAITPRVVGQRVGLHPLAVIFSVLIFSRFLGFWGLLIGVPTAAVIKFIIDEAKRRRKWREMLDSKTIAKNRERSEGKPGRKKRNPSG